MVITQLPNVFTQLPLSLSSSLWHHDRLLRIERLAGIRGNLYQQGLFAINEITGVECCEFEAVAVCDGVCGAGLNAITAEDAAVIVDVIDLGVTLSAADALFFSIVRRLNINAVGRARRRAQKTGYAFFQAVFVALQLVQSAETFLKNRALIRQLLVGIVLNNGGSKHLPKGDRHSFGNAENISENRHANSIIRNPKGHKTMLAIKPRSLVCSLIAPVLLILTMDQTSSAQAAISQTPQELLHAMIGQKLLMRHFGGFKDTRVKKKDLTSTKENCDIAIQVKNATWDKGKALFVWEDIGTPSIPGKPGGVCKNSYEEGTLTITGFAADESAPSLADSLRTVLQTPEQFLEAAGISFTLPPGPDLPGEVGVLEKPFTPAKALFIVDAAFSKQALESKYQGILAVRFYVGTDGRAHSPQIFHPLGMGLDEQTLNVVSMWRFEPARKLDQPVPARMSIEMSFNLF